MLRESEERKSRAHERHRTVAQFRAAESFGVQPTGFLELERGFLRDAETEPSADDVETAGLPKVLDGAAPVELPRKFQLVRRLFQRRCSSRSCVQPATRCTIAASEAMYDFVAATLVSTPARSGTT